MWNVAAKKKGLFVRTCINRRDNIEYIAIMFDNREIRDDQGEMISFYTKRLKIDAEKLIMSTDS